MGQWLKSLPCTPIIPYGHGSNPSNPVSHLSPSCGPGKQSRTAQSCGTLHTPRRPRRGSWLWIGIALADTLTWGVNHWTKDLPLCLSSLYIRLSNKNKSFKKIIVPLKPYKRPRRSSSYCWESTRQGKISLSLYHYMPLL